MKQDFDYDLMKKDWEDFIDYFRKFFKSFGPSPSQYSLKDEWRIQFGLWWNTKMGPVRQFKLAVTVIVFILGFFFLFLKSGLVFKIIEAVLFILFYGWLWSTEIEADEKDGKYLTNNLFDKLAAGLHGIVASIFAKKEEKKN
ncbi:MAG: hypothetical protein JWM20_263 [Patescibacteria group bacterium]|nr:hypothetical protein [Patescibacteria group bacterium]